MITSLPLLLLTFSLPPASTQDGAEAAVKPAAETSAEELRERIHGMRMNLLLGGDHVRKAENEAVTFYGGKVGLIEQRLDSIRVDLSEQRASYDLLLERALNGDDPGVRNQAMKDAAQLRAGITSLESEATDLERKRDHLSQMVSTVESRDRERERLVAQIETNADYMGDGFGFPMAGIGLAPIVEATQAGSPLDDAGFVDDLLQRDPRGARRLLFESDPIHYWDRFPLRPPADIVRKAFTFPLPDLPGQR